MATVNILTFHFSSNVGAMLQTYGLVKAVQNLGHSVSVIDYRPPKIKAILQGRLPRNPLNYIRVHNIRKKREAFLQRHIPLTREYSSFQELKDEPPKSDIIICGSDQIWNIYSPARGFDPVFFLGFLQENRTRRVSYAPSFGNGNVVIDFKAEISELLMKFDFLSVRDLDSNKAMVELTGRKVEQVLDPTFLSDYNPIIPKNKVNIPYIFVYCFQNNDLNKIAIQAIKEKFNMPVISVKRHFQGVKVVNPDPIEWLGLIANASYVCTDSFHGTCFSLIFKKQFVTLQFPGRNNRSEDLLTKLGLSNILVANHAQLTKALSKKINFLSAEAKIEELRAKSINYLHQALHEAKP